MTRPSPERQRELLEEYKKTPKQMGVYCIHNTADDRRYVAASRDIQARFNRHSFELRTGVERLSEELQSDWTRLGPDPFEFVVLEVLEPLDDLDYDPTEDLNVLEALWLEKLQPFEPNGYNPTLGDSLLV